MKQKVLMVGGAGYIGSILVEYLLQMGFRVTVIDNFMYKQQGLLGLVDNPNLTIISRASDDNSDTKLKIAGANNVGAGDASLAGYLAAESSGSDFATAISTAMSWASAACQNPGTAGLNLKAAKGAAATITTLS